MADEIAQVCQLEYEGIQMVVKGSLKFAEAAFEALKALIDYSKNKIHEVGGQKTMKTMFEISEEAPQVLFIDEKYFDDFIESCEKNHLRFHKLADLNSADGKKPLLIASQDVALYNAILKTYLENDVKESEKKLLGYDEQIAEKKEELINATPEERAQLQKEIANIEQARDELSNMITNDRTMLDNEDNSVSFQDYLASGKNTEFEKNPDKAISELEKGVPITSSFDVKEILQPVREKALAPESGMNFYVPDTGATITRVFKTDENNLLYSEYAFKDKDGIVTEYSDKDMTKEDWNKLVLGKLINEAGMLEESKCVPFGSQEHLEAYKNYFNKVVTKAEEEVSKRGEDDTEDFSNADVQEETLYAMDQQRKKEASAIDKHDITFHVPDNLIYQKDGRIVVKLDDNRELQFMGIKDGVAKDGYLDISIDSKSSIACVFGENDDEYTSIISADKGLDMFNDALEARNETSAEMGKQTTRA